MADPISRFQRSFRLIRASWEVLSSDGDLLILPAISIVATLVLLGGFAAGMMASGVLPDGAQAVPSGETTRWLGQMWPWVFLLYVGQYFIVYFFNTALVGAAIERLDGGEPTVRSALRLAVSRIGPILGYAIISATVGVILQALRERLGIIGRIVVGLIGVTWTLATFLVVPILAAEGRGPFEAIIESGSLLKKTWGENVIGNAGIGLVLGLIAAVIMVGGFGGGAALYQNGHELLGIPLMSVSIASLAMVILVGAALSAVYQAAVYYYAVHGEPPRDFDRTLIRDAFAPKGS